jgi:hypothetical protein
MTNRITVLRPEEPAWDGSCYLSRRVVLEKEVLW